MNRVAGTSITAIELGVVGGMLLPLAIYLAIYDTERSRAKRWAPVALIFLAMTTAVSRSAIISVGLAFVVLVVLMPPRQRLIALCAAPLAVTGVFMSAHGLIGTLASFFGAGTSDDSVGLGCTTTQRSSGSCGRRHGSATAAVRTCPRTFSTYSTTSI